jgi:integrase/recombinase XerD
MSNSCQNKRTINSVILHSANSSQMEGSTPESVETTIIPTQADTDQQLIMLWLHGKSIHTQRYYQSDIQHFFDFTNKSLMQTILKDLQDFADYLNTKELADSSIRRILSSVKSLFAFSLKLGYLPFDTSRPLILPNPKDTLAERILSADEVHRIINNENIPRNKLILKTLFITGIRVSELCSLIWKDLQDRSEGGQMTVYGKGSKTRTLLIPEPLWTELKEYQGNNSAESSIFRGRKNSQKLHPTTILRIVKRASKRAGIRKAVSPHWFRHSHASIASEKAPLHVIQQSLGHESIQTTARYLHVKPNDCSSKYLEL